MSEMIIWLCSGMAFVIGFAGGILAYHAIKPKVAISHRNRNDVVVAVKVDAEQAYAQLKRINKSIEDIKNQFCSK